MAEDSSSLGVVSDPILGLEVCSKRFYSHRSTLVNGSQYFASRFNGNLQPGDHLGTDEFGRDVYFVDRDGELFSHLLAFLRNNIVDLPSYQENPSLWKALRREALYLGIDGLVSQLQVTYSCRPSPGIRRGDRGILYYLGTNHGRSETYENPYLAGKVNVLGSIDDPNLPDWIDNPMQERNSALEPCTCRSYCKAMFVHYRQPLRGLISPYLEFSALYYCEGHVGVHIIIDMQNLRIRPSHYSMRGSDCFCLTSDWKFEGSTDCASWKCLHHGTSDCHVANMSDDTEAAIGQRLGVSLRYVLGTSIETLTAQQRAYLTDQAEEHLRGTWSIPDFESNDFYRFFRIQKVSHTGCFHATSFEVFGDVNECPEV